jgi:hypothetical protein
MDRTSIRTFNPAKKFAEEVLHPLIQSHSNAKLRSRLGAVSDDIAMKMPPEMRVVKRFNALKERIVILQTLTNEVEGTVRLNGRKSEIALLEEITKQLSILEDSYDDRANELMDEGNRDLDVRPKLTPLFKEMNSYVDQLYVQLQRIMTKNKLLFFGDDDEFLDDDDLQKIMDVENEGS